MTSKKELLDSLMEKVTHDALSTIRDILSKVLEDELANALTTSLVDSEFHKKVNEELRSGLGDIYREIHSVHMEEVSEVQTEDDTRQLFTEASDQLDKIFKTTEKATVEIMDIVERNLEEQEQVVTTLDSLSRKFPGDEDVEKLMVKNTSLNDDLIAIMTALSFQDLTGQRIKRIVSTLKSVEKLVFNLYLSSGLVLKAREKTPDKDFEEIIQESQKTVSELKGPQDGTTQNDVDDLLSQLGLE